MTYQPKTSINLADGPNVDLFGRLRVSNPVTIFASKVIENKQPLVWTEKLTNGGTSTHVASRASVNLAVTSNGDKVTRQTRQRLVYQPGKPLLMQITFIMSRDTVATGATSRVGYFDDDNGMFLELEGTQLQAVCRSDGVDAAVIAQEDWNVDPMDGTGPSGVTLDLTKIQLFAGDIQWMGAGRVRFALTVGDETHVVHIFNHANVLDHPYMINPNLPVRYELESTGSARTMDCICADMVAEGLTVPDGDIHSVDMGVTAKTISAAHNLVPLISIRLNPTHQHAVTVPTGYHVICPTGAAMRLVLVINPTIAGTDAASWQSVDDSEIQYDVSRDTTNQVTGGHVVHVGYVSSAKDAGLDSDNLDIRSRIGWDVDGNSDELVLAAQIISGTNKDVYASLDLREIGENATFPGVNAALVVFAQRCHANRVGTKTHRRHPWQAAHTAESSRPDRATSSRLLLPPNSAISTASLTRVRPGSPSAPRQPMPSRSPFNSTMPTAMPSRARRG